MDSSSLNYRLIFGKRLAKNSGEDLQGLDTITESSSEQDKEAELEVPMKAE